MSPTLETLVREATLRFGLSPAPAPVTPTATTAPTAATAPTPAPAVPPASGSASASAAVTAVATPAEPLLPGATDFRRRGWNLDVTVASEDVVLAAQWLDQHGFAIDAVTGVDWLAQGQMEVVYDFFHPVVPLRVVVRTRVPREQPELPTISGVFPGANWHERETHDFFGLRFRGHPDLSPFLLPEDADYHPLRKDFACAA